MFGQLHPQHQGHNRWRRKGHQMKSNKAAMMVHRFCSRPFHIVPMHGVLVPREFMQELFRRSAEKQQA
jgi:hypothetical protein